ncbi:MAG: trypsin-like peptidase domain-containing protein [Ignavibacteria bacterium]|nr:trypsin-like peptidase domain-containing protein [Ignavibacteria bacterium]
MNAKVTFLKTNLKSLFLSIFLLQFINSFCQNASKVFEKVSIATGLVTDGKGVGSGFFINNNTFITNNHVAQHINIRSAEIRTKDRIFEIESLIDYDMAVDLAVLKVKETNEYYLKICNPDSIIVGMPVFAIGNPTTADTKIFKNTFTQGIINNITYDKIKGGDMNINANVILHSAILNPGNSGGPLVNSNGDVCGVNSYIRYNAENMNFAIHVKELISLLNQNNITYETESGKINNSKRVADSVNQKTPSSKNIDSMSKVDLSKSRDSSTIILSNNSDSGYTFILLISGFGIIFLVVIVFLYSNKRENQLSSNSQYFVQERVVYAEPADNTSVSEEFSPYFLYGNNKFLIHKEEFIVGRDSMCDMIIEDKKISRYQFKINKSEGRCLLTDLDSKNGTLVNGDKVKMKILYKGDIVSVGAHKILFNYN